MRAQRYGILIDRGQIAELMESVHQATLKQAHTDQARPDALQNLCILLWSACERYCRGELLSARQYLDGFAVNQLLTLVSRCDRESVEEGKDALDPRRRLELRSPVLATEVLSILRNPVPQAAFQLLEIVERELKPKAPTLAWDEVTMVRGWIADLLRLYQSSNQPSDGPKHAIAFSRSLFDWRVACNRAGSTPLVILDGKEVPTG